MKDYKIWNNSIICYNNISIDKSWKYVVCTPLVPISGIHNVTIPSIQAIMFV